MLSNPVFAFFAGVAIGVVLTVGFAFAMSKFAPAVSETGEGQLS